MSTPLGRAQLDNARRGQHQIANVIERIKKNPNDRRLIVNAWNVEDVESGAMALAPCHVMFQFWGRPLTFKERFDALFDIDRGAWKALNEKMEGVVDLPNDYEVPKYALSCQLYQRSADVFWVSRSTSPPTRY